MPQDTRERMLDATASLLQQHGFHGTSLNGILDESGAPRGSLYHHFPGGKEQIALEATARSVDRVTAALEQLVQPGSDPVAAVRACVEAAAEELRASDFVFGCPVAHIVLDLGEDSSEIARVCRAALAAWRRILVRGFAAAGIPSGRATSLAITIVAALEGALLLARATRDTAPLAAIADELGPLIEAAGA